MADTRHQCRYCAYCVYTLEGTWWCDELNKYCERPKRPNCCKTWLFNEIAADDLEKKFSPRPKKEHRFVQPRLFDMPTDRQRQQQTTKRLENQQ